MESKASYGIKDTTHPCLSNWDVCEPTNAFTCKNPSEYFFFDFVHPSTVTHRALAQKMYNGVRALLLQGKASSG
jgi:phospholipase/lecithinase/hemolysin